MDPRSYLAGAVGAPPAAPSSPSVGYPTNGNPLTPLDPTTPGAHYFYKLGEELRNIIVAAGLTPSDGNLSQLLAALNTGWGMANLHVATGGYQKLPGGLLVQWGISPIIDAYTAYDITLPIAYTTIHLAAFLTFVDTASFANTPQVGQVRGGPTDLTLLKMGNTADNPNQFNWLSIGK